MATDARPTRPVAVQRPTPKPPVRPKQQPKRPAPRRRWRRALLVTGITVLVVVLALVGGGLLYVSRTSLPKAPAESQTSFVYDASGHLLASFNGGQNRVDVTLHQVPKVLINAVVSTEDRHFFSEGALNPLSTVRAAFADLRGKPLQGGSTITQQYVKNAYTGNQRTIFRKLREAVLAEKLSRKLSKDAILQDYLNTIYFGRGAYGVEAASQAYFGRDVGQLDLARASLLAGLIHDPGGDDPAHSLPRAKARQDQVLAGMLRDHKITRAQLEAVEARPMTSYVNMHPAGNTGVTMNSANGDQFFIADVRQQLINRFGAKMVYGGGLRVTTTLDPKLQADAYRAMYEGPNGLDPRRGDPAGALVSLDDQGNVKAMVGGQDWAASQVNLALGRAGGGSGRQAGSTFKAFMLAQLVKEGYSVESQIPAPPSLVIPHGNSNGSPWVVKNFESENPGHPLSVVDATAQSVNTVFAQLVTTLGPKALEQMAVSCGLDPHELGAYPSLVLGAAPVSPLEMASGYSTFADNGVHQPATVITKVTTASGKPLAWSHPAAHQVLSSQQDAVVNYTLQQVVQRGTATAATSVGVPLAGKTGTTDNSTDAWFIGYTPKLTTAVWMGYPQGSRPLTNFRGYTSIQGGTIPTELFSAYLSAALHDEPQWGGQGFAPPASLGGKYLTVTPGSVPGVSYPPTSAAPTTAPYVPPPTTAPAPTAAYSVPPAPAPTAAPTTAPAPPPTPATTSPPTQPPTTPPTTAAQTTTTQPTTTTTKPHGRRG